VLGIAALFVTTGVMKNLGVAGENPTHQPVKKSVGQDLFYPTLALPQVHEPISIWALPTPDPATILLFFYG
jgi:hypothetical protein